MVRSVQDEVLAHDGQTNEAKISTGFRLRRSTDIDAGETRTTVSITFLSIPCAMKNLQGGGNTARFVERATDRLAGYEHALQSRSLHMMGREVKLFKADLHCLVRHDDDVCCFGLNLG